MAANPKSAKREKTSAVDTAWLRMDRPHNLMMISGVLLFRERVALSRLRRVINDRFAVFPRFRKIPVELPGGAFWQADPQFDIVRHVVAAALPGRAGREELEAFVSDLASSPLDPARPRWQFQLVDHSGGRSAVLRRIPHTHARRIALRPRM